MTRCSRLLPFSLLSLLSLLTALSGCTSGKDSGHEEEEEGAAPAITLLDPLDGDTVPAGDVGLSFIVENFTLIDPAKHNEGTPEGYISVTVDGAEVLQTASTQVTVTLAAGAHTVGGVLRYEDGDEAGAETEIGLTAE